MKEVSGASILAVPSSVGVTETKESQAAMPRSPENRKPRSRNRERARGKGSRRMKTYVR